LSIGELLDLSTMIIGTSRGLIGMELQDANKRLNEALGGDIHLRFSVSSSDNLDILREHMFLG
jgi:hypothetical protein